MRKKVNRYRYNIVEISKYIKQNNLEPPLSEEELEPFILEKETFPDTALPIEEGECYVCGKKTSWVDRIHIVHVCSEECTTALDRKYEKGENIIRNEEIYRHLKEHEFNLMMDLEND